MDPDPAADPPLTPEARRKPEAGGTPVTIAGETWLLADHVADLGPVWGRLFDQNQIAPRYDPADVRLGALRLLTENYTLTLDEAVALILSAVAGDLVAAVEAALFGPEPLHRTYPDWVASALWSNGIDPARVPAKYLRHVLDQLVMTKRAAPTHKFISSAEAAEFFRSQP